MGVQTTSDFEGQEELTAMPTLLLLCVPKEVLRGQRIQIIIMIKFFWRKRTKTFRASGFAIRNVHFVFFFLFAQSKARKTEVKKTHSLSIARKSVLRKREGRRNQKRPSKGLFWKLSYIGLTLIFLTLSSGTTFGISIVSTPALRLAAAFSATVEVGKITERLKLPQKHSWT